MLSFFHSLIRVISLLVKVKYNIMYAAIIFVHI